MPVVKDKHVIEDDWQLLTEQDVNEPLPVGDIIVPFDYWKVNKSSLLARAGGLGICINGDDMIEEVAEDLEHFQLVALEFPAFKDGRCYSHARLLRDRYGYKGEIRAVGDVLRDQLFYMQRCGIDSFQLSEDKGVEDAIKGFSDFSVTYQSAADGALPAYKNR